MDSGLQFRIRWTVLNELLSLCGWGAYKKSRIGLSKPGGCYDRLDAVLHFDPMPGL